MSTALSKTEQDEYNAFLKSAMECGGAIRRLKFAKGKFKIEDDVVTDHEMIAHIGSTRKGWIKFHDSKVVDERLGRVADHYQPPGRYDLGDMDQSEWELDADKKPRDPWVFVYVLPFEDPDTGDLLTFSTGSKGGMGAVGKLLVVHARNMGRGSPTVKLAVRTYMHPNPQFGEIFTPDFKVVAWEGRQPLDLGAARNGHGAEGIIEESDGPLRIDRDDDFQDE